MKTLFLILVCIISISFLYSEKITIKTNDGCNISAFINIVSTQNPIIFQVHGLGSSKEEWNKLNTELDKEKINRISIDLRGHGESVKCRNKIIKNYQELNADDLKGFLKDIDSVYKYITSKYQKMKIIPIGASIGANVVFEYFYKKFGKIVLISPSLNYGGFEPTQFFKKTKSKILFIVSQNDIYSFNSTRVFIDICEKSQKHYNIIIAENGHGVQIFDTEKGKEYINQIINWIKN